MATVLTIIREEISDTQAIPKYSDDRLIRWANMGGQKIGEVTGHVLSFDANTLEDSITLNELEALLLFVKWKVCVDGAETNAKGFKYNEGVYQVDKSNLGKNQMETCKLIWETFDDLLTTITPDNGFKSMIQGTVYVKPYS